MTSEHGLFRARSNDANHVGLKHRGPADGMFFGRMTKNTIMKRGAWWVIGLLALVQGAGAQQPLPTDTLKTIELTALEVTSYRERQTTLKTLPSVHGNMVVSGMRHEVIDLGDLAASLPEKNARQVFARVPGAFVYDMDGSGNQVNLATRGLDPHRSWEFNVRQDGLMVNSDIYGYPASHYSPPLEAMERIELIRGAASLQYGSQFGGMLNYVLKRPDTTRILTYEGSSIAGAFGTLGTFQRIGFHQGAWTVQAWAQYRQADGYRRVARTSSSAQHASLTWRPARAFSIRAEYSRGEYRYRMPGPLTDAQFAEAPRQATRERNHYGPDIHIPALHLDWSPSAATHLSLKASWLYGFRNSVMFIGFANQPDTILAATGQYAPRQVDIDGFDSRQVELRLRHDHRLLGSTQTLVAGTHLILNDLHRRQLGKGSTGTDFDLSVDAAGFGRDLHFLSRNAAVWLEELIRIGDRFELAPGLRWELGDTRRSGTIRDMDPASIPLRLDRNFLLLGGSGSYKATREMQCYGGWSQAYRPVILSATIPASIQERIDPELRDATGHNAEVGIRGSAWQGRLRYDLGVFEMIYRNRTGVIEVEEPNGTSLLYRTNTGDSRTLGAEAYAECRFWRTGTFDLSAFTASSWMDARYISGSLFRAGENVALRGNRVETVPQWTTRNGLNARYRNFALALQYSHVDDSFSDAFNTPAPTATGSAGPVPGYGLWDLHLSWNHGRRLSVALSVTNLSDERYFTKRPTGYPGAGVWPSDGRSWSVTVRQGI